MTGDRITQRDLEQLCRVINGRTVGDADATPYSRSPDGGVTANIGVYYIDGAYGGIALYRIVTAGGGVADVLSCGHVPKRDLYGRLRAFLEGLEAAAG